MNELILLAALTAVVLTVVGALLFKPKLGLYLFLAFAPFSYYYAYLAANPYAAGSLLQKSTRDIFILALYFIWLFYFLVKKKGRLPIFKASLVAVLFICLALLQTIRAFDLPGYNAFIGLRNAVEFIPLIIIIPSFFKNSEDGLKNIINISILCGLIVALLGFYELYTKLIGFDPIQFLKAFNSFRIRSTLFNPNNLGCFQSTMLLLLLGSYFQKQYLFNKILSQGAILVLFVSMLTSFSRGALFGFLVGLAYMLIIAKKTRVLLMIGVISVMLFFIVNSFSPLALYRYYSLIEQGTGSDSVKGRMYSINAAAEQIANDPMILLAGIGFDKVGSIIDINAENNTTDSRKWLGQAGSPDNYYVLLILAGGISALVVFLSILYILIREALKIARLSGNPFSQGLAAGIGAVFINYALIGLTGDLWGTFPPNFYFWLLAGMLLTAKRLARETA